MTDLVMRHAIGDDAEALHTLISAHLKEGHLLPRQLDELRVRAHRFVIAEHGGKLMACAELAPLSPSVAEVRSLVVAGPMRRVGLAARLTEELRERAQALGFNRLCAFTHDARFFVRQGFSIVPHLWLPEKIATDCVTCPLFRNCGQYAVILPLEAVARVGAVNPASRINVA